MQLFFIETAGNLIVFADVVIISTFANILHSALRQFVVAVFMSAALSSETSLWVWRTAMWSTGTRSLWVWWTEAQTESSWVQRLTEGSFYSATCLTLHFHQVITIAVFFLLWQVSSWKHGIFREHRGWASQPGSSAALPSLYHQNASFD